jgi:hypothetical protein
MKKFLIFTGIGDRDHQCFSWLDTASDVYDRACFHYGDSESVSDLIKSKKPEYYYKCKGEIWKNFVSLYEQFSEYDYVLIVDSDLELDVDHLTKTFIMAEQNNWTACQWSRDGDSHGAFVKPYTTKKTGVRETNFVEMIFMLLRKDVLFSLVDQWRNMNLTYSDGVDFVLTNLAIHNKWLPFHVIDDFCFYNPHPHNKGGVREIDHASNTTFEIRIKQLHDIMQSNPKYWRFPHKDGRTVVHCGDETLIIYQSR